MKVTIYSSLFLCFFVSDDSSKLLGVRVEKLFVCIHEGGCGFIDASHLKGLKVLVSLYTPSKDL